MTDAQRNLPQEREALRPLSKSILDVWQKQDNSSAMRRAADELLFSRFWLEKMEHDIRYGQEMVGRALKRQGDLIRLVTEVRNQLREMVTSYDPVTQGGPEIHSDEVEELIAKIDSIMNRKTESPVEE